jgi:hypothetical protein
VWTKVSEHVVDLLLPKFEALSRFVKVVYDLLAFVGADATIVCDLRRQQRVGKIYSFCESTVCVSVFGFLERACM